MPRHLPGQVCLLLLILWISCLAGQYTWPEAPTLTRRIRLQIIV